MREALIAYTLGCLLPEAHNLISVAQLCDDSSPHILGDLIGEPFAINPESCAISRWRRQTCQKEEKI